MISVENERNFENMLFADASALPPPQDTVTPWHTAMHYILWGLGLTTITLRFLNLDVILTAVGAALLVLGFRILRRENASLRWGFRLALAALAVRSACYVLAALPVEAGMAPAYTAMALQLAVYVCLWRGMIGVSRSAGAEKPAAPAAGALVIFYILLAALAIIGTRHTLLVLLLLLVYVLILRNLARLFRSLADTGYAVTAAPVRVSNGVLLWSYLGALLAAVLLCMFLGQRFPAALHLRDDAPQEEQIRQELLQKGFPRNVLDDLTADEVAKMAGARAVYRETDKLYNDTEYREITLTHYIADPAYPLQFDRTVTTKNDDGTRTYTYVYRAYDTLEQTMTGVAVELADGQYIVIHHLRYDTQPAARYTEGMTVWPAWKVEQDWTRGTLCSGRLLCTRQGQEQTAALHGLTYDDGQITDIFGTRSADSFVAQWSRPSRAEDVRVYVLYDTFRTGGADVLTSYGNYICQTKPVYPFDGRVLQWGFGQERARTRHMSAIQLWLGESGD